MMCRKIWVLSSNIPESSLWGLNSSYKKLDYLNRIGLNKRIPYRSKNKKYSSWEIQRNGSWIKKIFRTSRSLLSTTVVRLLKLCYLNNQFKFKIWNKTMHFTYQSCPCMGTKTFLGALKGIVIILDNFQLKWRLVINKLEQYGIRFLTSSQILSRKSMQFGLCKAKK